MLAGMLFSASSGAMEPTLPEPAADGEHAPQAEREPIQVCLDELISGLREKHALVGLAAMVMVDGEVIASIADGERSRGSGILLETGDPWHVGSVTKSVTATMIARLIERGQLDWCTSLEDSLGDALTLHEDWKAVTLEELLTHTSGAPADFPFIIAFQFPEKGPDRSAARLDAVQLIVEQPLNSAPGSKFRYSNAGYTIAGVLAEVTTGQTWEDLVQTEVFEPLELDDCGFGPPRHRDEEFDVPRGHQKFLWFKRAAGEWEDNTPTIGPAGILHMSLSSMCRFANEHRIGEAGEGKLLTADTYKRLHTPQLKDYACGWIVNNPSRWTDGRVLWHNGSNTMWYAMLAIVPDWNAVVAITSNDGDIDRAEEAAVTIIEKVGTLLSAAHDTPNAPGPHSEED